MISLEKFYYYVLRKTLPGDRYFAIQELQDIVIVNLDCLYDRECLIRGTDQLLFLLHKKGHNKRFLFISEDGALIAPSGAIEIIKNIIKTFNLTTDTCCLVCREYLTIDNCNVITNDAVPYWCKVLHPYIKNITIALGPFEKKFALWVHRGAIHRLELAKHLTQYADQSYISYQESGVIVDRNLVDYFASDIDWAQTNTPIIYDQLFPNRVFDFDMIVGDTRKPYNNYAVEIVAETDIITSDWITEKTIKNLYIGKVFIVMSGAGSLRKIRNYGFKTFSPWVNEEYDTIENISDRLNAIKNEIDRLATINLNEIYLELAPILEHNRKVYEDLIGRR